ncbi:FecR domain-containing protein [Roseateles chitinivorans]|uniref:FecR domain-containing protein n=1 Tax=Roseateles chitinivorans TaxID=2917965 RepID=UPI003D67B557
MTSSSPASGELHPAVVEAAVAWMVKLQSGRATPQDHEACEHWRHERPEHAQAWATLSGFSQRLKTLPPSLARSALAATRELERERAPRRRALLKGVALLAGTAGIGLASSPDGGWKSLAASHRTGVGERRRVALADGSVLHLNTATAVDVRVDAHERCIDLLAGEVLVECARDTGTGTGTSTGTGNGSATSRPFVVRTAQGRIQADEGRFIVRQLAAQTFVQALDGWVDVSPGSGQLASRRLAAGRQWAFDARGVGAVEAANGDAGAWVDGVIVARDMPLAALAAELSRYRHGWLRCDPAVARLRISGVFPVDDLHRVIAAIQRTLPVRARTRTSWWVTLEAR